jgi:DNA-binding response OmpR family regulator
MTTQKKILIIEDEPLIASAYSKKFELAGYAALVAHDGQAGLALALTEHPEAILLDIIMPKMDGWGVLKKLRKDKWGENALVIMLTNISDIQLVKDRLKFGVFDYLIKSDHTPEQILEYVQEKIGDRRSSS